MTSERPLPPRARATLVVAAAATIFVFYGAAILSMTILGALVLALLVLAAGAARVGAAGFVARLMAPPARMFQIIARRLWLSTEPTYQLTLERSDAPRLFELVTDLARRLKVRPPDTVVVEMHCGAWVLLEGFGRASGKTTLGIGYDLLAGLSVSEIEVVLAHELAHARLVQRGFSRWLKKGLARLIGVTEALAQYNAERANAKEQSEDLTYWCFKAFDALTVRAVRLVATYSRQDEFEADGTAANVCGASAMRLALIKLHALDDAVARLPWSERFARLQPGEHFGEWLVSELARLVEIGDDEPVRHAADPYSTHPTLRDRVSALPADDRTIGRAGSGLELLAEPDRVAERLAAEIQRVVAIQERRNTRVLARETKKFCKRGNTTGFEVLGVIAIGFGVIMALVILTGEFAPDTTATAIVSLAIGIGLYRAGKYRDRRMLPVPAYGMLATWKPFATREQLAAAEKALFDELRSEAGGKGSKRNKLDFLITTAYSALQQRDYLRAHVAARQALEIKKKSVEASLAYAIAAAAIGNVEQTQRALAVVKQQAGFTSLSTKWGAAWAMVMLDDWGAEGLLQQLHDREPTLATYAALLGLAQQNRGKLHSAIDNVKTACALDPQNHACAELLINLLLQLGRPREAAERAASLADIARVDTRVAFLMVRINLMRRDVSAATEWARVVRSLDPGGDWLIALGSVFVSARLDHVAGTFFSNALATSFTPQANIGLAVLATIGGDRARAKQHLLAALKFENARIAGQDTPASLFHEIVGRLNALDERRVSCTAWIASIPAEPVSALAGLSLLVCAADESAAKAHLGEIVAAMQTGDAPLDLSTVTWRVAPEERQPLRPIQAGVQFVVS